MIYPSKNRYTSLTSKIRREASGRSLQIVVGMRTYDSKTETDQVAVEWAQAIKNAKASEKKAADGGMLFCLHCFEHCVLFWQPHKILT